MKKIRAWFLRNTSMLLVALGLTLITAGVWTYAMGWGLITGGVSAFFFEWRLSVEREGRR